MILKYILKKNHCCNLQSYNKNILEVREKMYNNEQYCLSILFIKKFVPFIKVQTRTKLFCNKSRFLKKNLILNNKKVM